MDSERSRCTFHRQMYHLSPSAWRFAYAGDAPPLPLERVQPAPPFSTVGLDVFGHWFVKSRATVGTRKISSVTKRWAVIFTCLYCRAVHVEILDSMSTDAFINAMRRFLAIRGPVSLLRSDQGSDFLGATSQLKQGDGIDQHHVKKFLLESGTEWIMNAPHSHHQRRDWERLIGLLRRVLDCALLKVSEQLTHDMLATFLCEAAAIVNSGPLTVLSSDVADPLPLTPNALLTGKTQCQQDRPLEGTPREHLYSARRWKTVQFIAEKFWERFRIEYLQDLQQRNKWSETRSNVDVGDIVLIRDSNASRGQWPMGVVCDSFPSDDGLVRRVTLTISRDGQKSQLSRPVSELVLLLRRREVD